MPLWPLTTWSMYGSPQTVISIFDKHDCCPWRAQAGPMTFLPLPPTWTPGHILQDKNQSQTCDCIIKVITYNIISKSAGAEEELRQDELFATLSPWPDQLPTLDPWAAVVQVEGGLVTWWVLGQVGATRNCYHL